MCEEWNRSNRGEFSCDGIIQNMPNETIGMAYFPGTLINNIPSTIHYVTVEQYLTSDPGFQNIIEHFKMKDDYCNYNFECDVKCDTCYIQQMVDSWYIQQDPPRNDRTDFEKESMCITCKEGFGLKSELDPAKAVEGGIFPWGMCERCHESCGECASPDNPSHCVTCAEGYEDNLEDGSSEMVKGKAVKKCKATMTSRTDCHPTCDTCYNAAQVNQAAISLRYQPFGELEENNKCSSCPNGKVLEKLPVIIDGFKNEATHGKCIKCDKSCKTCHGTDNESCTSCYSNGQLNQLEDEYGKRMTPDGSEYLKSCESMKSLDCDNYCSNFDIFTNHINTYDCLECNPDYNLIDKYEVIIPNQIIDPRYNKEDRYVPDKICYKTDSDQKYYHSDNVYKIQNNKPKFMGIDEAYNYCNEDDSCIGFNYLTYYVYDTDNDEYSNENKPEQIECDNKFEVHFAHLYDKNETVLNGKYTINNNLELLSRDDKHYLRMIEGNEYLDTNKLKSATKTFNVNNVNIGVVIEASPPEENPGDSPTPLVVSAPRDSPPTTERFTIGGQENVTPEETPMVTPIETPMVTPMVGVPEDLSSSKVEFKSKLPFISPNISINKKITPLPYLKLSKIKTDLINASHYCNANENCVGFDADFSDIDKILFNNTKMDYSYTSEIGENEVNKMLYDVRSYEFYEKIDERFEENIKFTDDNQDYITFQK